MSEEFVRGGELDLRSDLQIGSKNLILVLDSEGNGSVPIPNNCTLVGVMITTEEQDIRIGLEPLQEQVTATGVAELSDLKNGIPQLGYLIWTWYNIGRGVDRTLYVVGAPACEMIVAVT